METQIPHLPAGTILGGRYRIERFIAAGGFGCTYEARHIRLGTRVAIKEFFPKKLCNRREGGTVSVGADDNRETVDKLKRKFEKEAQALSSFQHEGIVRVLDVFDENQTIYYVMDYIEGRSLADILKQRFLKHEGPLPEQEVLGYIRQVASALAYVHQRNHLHLDLKPDNIMLDAQGRAILIDFGAAKHYEEASGRATTTTQGILSPGYAPFEQEAKSVTTFSPSTDIYSLGATIYKLLTGVTPPRASLLKDDEETLAPLPDHITPATRRAVNAAMQLKRKDRPQSIADFLRLLDSDGGASSEKTEIDPEIIVTIDPEPVKSEPVRPTPAKPTPAKPTPVKAKTVEAEPIAIYEKESGRWKWIYLGIFAAVIALGVYIYQRSQKQREISEIYIISGTINGHDYVDLGLPSGVKWATCNVGADSPEDYGDYFAWGETEPKSEYTFENSLTYYKRFKELESAGIITSSGNLAPAYDAASVNWGGSWRMPTKDEIEELIDNCSTTWTTLNGVKGYKVTSKTNGKSLFLPAAGYRDGSRLCSAGTYSRYWSSTPDSNGGSGAYSLYFNSLCFGCNYENRKDGLLVRPVSD